LLAEDEAEMQSKRLILSLSLSLYAHTMHPRAVEISSISGAATMPELLSLALRQISILFRDTPEKFDSIYVRNWSIHWAMHPRLLLCWLCLLCVDAR